MDTMNRDRARGALLGLAVGDALGTTYEFARIEQAAYPALATGPATDVVGGGPFDLPAGAITDDTQLAVCLARSLAERGRFDADDVARRYVLWSEHAFDIGNQTRGAIDRLEAGMAPARAGVETWRASDLRAAGNGSLMRAAPIGVWAARTRAGDPDDATDGGTEIAHALVDAMIGDSLITHADPRCLLACVAFDAAVGAGVGGMGAPMMRNAARAWLALGAERLAALWAGEDPTERAAIDAAVAALESDLDAAEADQPGVYSVGLDLHRTAGFVRVAFRLAFWHLAHTPSWRDAVVDVASRGGDADTNAAIVGALLGARDGASAIPAAWVERVLGATQRGPAAWGEAHHPRHLLALAE